MSSVHFMGQLEEAFEAKFMSFFSAESNSMNDISSSATTSSSSYKLPKSSSTEEEEVFAPPSTSSKKKSSKKSTKKKKSKKKSLKKKRRSRERISDYENIGSTSNAVVMDVTQMQVEGMEINIAQSVCDDGKPTLGEDAKSYFLMRHNFSYPGPWSVMVGGPNALTSYGYRVSAEVVSRDDCVLVGTLQPNFRNVEGVWEQTWNEYLKTHVSFMAGKASTQQMGMLGQISLPTGVMYGDFHPTSSSCGRLKCDMMQKELSLSFHKMILNENRLSLSLGSKLSTSFDRKSNDLEFAASLKRSGSVWEAIMKPRHSLYQLFYTRQISDNGSALTGRLQLSAATMNAQASFGYKYVFGKMNYQRMICGEISSDGYVRQTFTIPLLNNMLLKMFGEMNHFLKPQQLQHGEMPHRFGAMIQIHM